MALPQPPGASLASWHYIFADFPSEFSPERRKSIFAFTPDISPERRTVLPFSARPALWIERRRRLFVSRLFVERLSCRRRRHFELSPELPFVDIRYAFVALTYRYIFQPSGTSHPDSHSCLLPDKQVMPTGVSHSPYAACFTTAEILISSFMPGLRTRHHASCRKASSFEGAFHSFSVSAGGCRRPGA